MKPARKIPRSWWLVPTLLLLPMAACRCPSPKTPPAVIVEKIRPCLSASDRPEPWEGYAFDASVLCLAMGFAACLTHDALQAAVHDNEHARAFYQRAAVNCEGP